MRRSLRFSDYFKSLVSVVAVLALSSVASSSFAQKCEVSFDGSIQSIIGTDFDWNTKSPNSYTPTWSVENTLMSTLGGVHVLPDGSPMQAFVPKDVIWTKDDRDITSPDNKGAKNAYFVTDKLEDLYGKNPYSIVPKGSNGNGFYILHNLQNAATGGLNYGFPYADFKGRDVVLEIKFYLGNKGMTPEDISSNKPVNGAPYGSLLPSHRANGNVSNNEPQHLLYAKKKNGFVDPVSTDKNYGNFRFQDFGLPWVDADKIYFTPLSNISKSSTGTENVNYPARQSGIANPYGYVEGCPEKNIQVHNCVGHINFGVGSSNGCLTASQVEYLGDPDYGFYPDGENSKGGWLYGNPSNEQEITRLSNGYWYGWYKMQVRFYIPDYGSGNSFTCFYSYMNTYLLSEHDFIAYDYINFKTAHICAGGDKYCPNQPIVLNAFNYNDGVQLEWQQMVAFIMDDYAKNTYTQTYNSFLGKPGDVWRSKDGKGSSVHVASIAKGDTVIVKQYDDYSSSEQAWVTFEKTADRQVKVIPKSEIYNNSYAIAFRAIDKSAARQESFEVWLRPNLDCLNNVGDGIEGPDVICMSDKPEFWATRDGEKTNIDKAITINWKLQYVGENKDINGLFLSSLDGVTVKPGFGTKEDLSLSQYANFNATYVNFDNNTLKEGVYRLSYTQSAISHVYDPNFPNDPNHAKKVEKVLDAPEVVKYIRVFKSPESVASILSGINQNGSVNTVCASNTTGSVEVLLKDKLQHSLPNVSQYNSIKGVIPFDQYYSMEYVYSPSVSVGSATVDPTKESVPAANKGVSNGTTVTFPITGLCDASQFSIGGGIQIVQIGDTKFSGSDYCKSFVEVKTEVNNPEMKVNCNSVNTGDRVFIAGPTAKDTIIKLTQNRIPQLAETVCDENPIVEFQYKDKDGVLVTVNTYRYKDFAAGDVKLPLQLGDNDVVFTYRDGCNNTASCSVTYTFEDVTPPNLPCSAITGRTISVRLSDLLPEAVADKVVTMTIDGVTQTDVAIPEVMKTANTSDSCSASFDHFTLLSNPPSAGSNVCLEDLNGVDGVICPTYGGRWTTDFDVLAQTSLAGYLGNFDKSISIWSVNYPVGSTYILWIYTDKAGNKSYCAQKVEVIDDLLPIIEGCNEDSITIGTELDKCELSFDALLDSLKQDLPTAKDPCSSAETSVRFEYWITPNGGTPYQFTSGSAPLKKGTYTFEIRAYKANGDNQFIDEKVYASCVRTITVEDKQGPTFNCDYLTTINVDVNKDTDPAHAIKRYVFDFASTKDVLEPCKPGSAGPGGFMPGFGEPPTMPCKDKAKATLEDVFKKGKDFDPAVILSKATDNCGGEVKLQMTVRTVKADASNQYDEVTYPATNDGNKLLEALRKTSFPKGVNFIVYTFVDSDGNETTCQQTVQVATIPEFEPACPDYDQTYPADENCEYVITAEEFYRNWQPKAARFKYTEVTENINCFGAMPTEEKSDATTTRTDLYPYLVEIVDANGAKISFENSNVNKGSYVVRKQRTCQGFGPLPKPIDVDIRKYTNLPFGKNDFTSVADKIVLPKGKFSITWYYGTDDQELGACFFEGEVVDETSPTLADCNLAPIRKPALDAPQCVLPFDQSGVKMATIEELQPSDNCTKELNDFTLTWSRSDGATEFETDFQIGTTTIYFTVSDKDGNSVDCTQEIEVYDGSVYFDCETLETPIEVTASANCDVEFDEVELKGLPTGLETPDCSNAAPIIGVPSRSDGKEFKDNFELGTTTITWTFTDSKGNSTSCPQTVIVKDEDEPVFDCNSITPNPIDYLSKSLGECNPTKEDVLAELGSYSAEDNCLGTIPGVPMLSNGPADEDREPLPPTFNLNETYIIKWVFDDTHGNVKVCRQTLIIKDNVNPNPTGCPANKVIDAADGQCLMSWDELSLSTPTISDPCEGSITASKIMLEVYIGGEYKTYLTEEIVADPSSILFPATTNEHIVHWIFVDKGGNEAECVQKININDKSAPFVECDPNGIFDSGEYVFSVTSSNVDCELDASEFNKMFTVPVAYDECEDIANGTDHKPIEPSKITRTYYATEADYSSETNGQSIEKADGSVDMDAPYKKGVTVLEYTFTDESGNVSETCKLPIKVVDMSDPYLDCTGIDTIKVTADATCQLDYQSIDFGTKSGWDYCDKDIDGNPKEIPAQIQLDRLSISQIPEDYSFAVGTYNLVWAVYDEAGNAAYCDQPLVIESNGDLDLDCNAYKEYTATAVKDECYAKFEDLNIDPLPVAYDKCMPTDPITGVPTRSDGKELSDDYPTGETTIVWSFKSPYAPETLAAVTCTSTVKVKGNKPFPEIDCESLFPSLSVTTDDCGPAVVTLTSKSQKDPCIDVFEAWAVPFARIDAKGDNYSVSVTESAEKHVYEHSFALGVDSVKWVFSDSTNSVHAYCYQQIELLTTKQMTGNCPESAGDVHLELEADECESVPSIAQLDSLKEGMWKMNNPCILDEHGDSIVIAGVPSRSDGKKLDDPYRFTTTIVWTFTDKTHTMKDSVVKCETKVIVGDREELINCDRDFPSINETLNGVCDYQYGRIDKIPFPEDPCSSAKAVVSLEIYKNDDNSFSNLISGETNITSFLTNNNFKLGNYRLHWNYSFTTSGGESYPVECDQLLNIKTDLQPDFNCSSLPSIMDVVLPKGDCEANTDYVLGQLPKPVATLCGVPVPGEPRLDDGSSDKGVKLPEIFKAGNDYHIIWLFENDSLSTGYTTCNNLLRIKSDSDPQFDCETFKKDTVWLSVSGDCDYILNPADMTIPEAIDSCSGSVIPGKAIIGGVEENIYSYSFPVGFTIITWKFESDYVTGVSYCDQVVNLKTDKLIEKPCDIAPLADINVAVEEGQCEVPSVSFTIPIATNPCTGAAIQGVGSVKDNPDQKLDKPFRTGQYTIVWTFTDESMTLIHDTAICEQTLNVGDVNTPPVDCNNEAYKDKLFELSPAEGCEVSARKVNLSAPKVYDLCSNDLVEPIVNRSSGNSLTDSYPIGVETITWKYVYKGTTIGTCTQKVTVRSKALDQFDCSLLASRVPVTLTLPGSYEATYSEVVAAGLKLPQYNDPCNVITEVVSRKDAVSTDKVLTDNYIIGETEITWTLTDNQVNGDTKTCKTIVEVVDQVIPELNCPPLDNSLTYECPNAVPDPYLTLDQFLAAGGSISDISRVKPGSFNHQDTDDSRSQGHCRYTITRKYTIKDLKEREISCEQQFVIDDKQAPSWAPGFATATYTFEDCGNVAPLPTDVMAYGDCTNQTYTMYPKSLNDSPVAEADRSSYIYYEDFSDKSNDRRDCKYYTYTMKRTFTAYDNCNNASTPVTITYEVKDITSPEISIDPLWSDSSIYAPWTKPCKFMVPDLKRYIPKGSFSDPCDETLVMFFDTIQTPAPGELIDQTQYVTLEIVDPCGNKASVQKKVYVPTRETVVDVQMHDTTICSYPEVKLSENRLSKVKGELYQYYEGELIKKSISFMYDFYRGKPEDLFPYGSADIHPSLLHSTNPTTYSTKLQALYGDRNTAKAEGEKKITMDRLTKSDFYTIVVMDTATMCTDTAFAKINIKERPRVKLDPTTFLVCEDDSIRLTDENLYDKFNVCVNDMDTFVIEQGWLLEDDLGKYNIDFHPNNANYNKMKQLLDLHESLIQEGKYEPHTLVPFTNSDMHLLYYATNACGTGTSYDSYYMPCEGEFDGKTDAEITDILGGSANFDSYKKDELLSNAEVTIDVKKRLHSSEFILTTKPQDKARVFIGENAELNLVTNNNPTELKWYRVNGIFDGRFEESFDRDGNIKPEYREYSDDADELMITTQNSEHNYKHMNLTSLTDTASYYVLALDGVCPAVQTNVVSINVVKQIPTAFTPQNSIGMNDVFMEGYPVMIFNRYGQKMVESDNGWDGTCRGNLVDPGVYFYEVTLNNGDTFKGSIEVVYFK